MQNNIIERLFASFAELDKAIVSAKKTLASKESVPPEVIKRLDSYDGILLKQKTLAKELCEHIASGNWDEVNRHVGLINGLSAMIRDDARAILAALSSAPDKATVDEDMNYC